MAKQRGGPAITELTDSGVSGDSRMLKGMSSRTE